MKPAVARAVAAIWRQLVTIPAGYDRLRVLGEIQRRHEAHALRQLTKIFNPRRKR